MPSDKTKSRTPQVQMLYDCIEILRQDKFQQEKSEEALYEAFLTWVAVRVCLEAQIPAPGLEMNTIIQLDQTFNLNLLKEDVWDHFGDLAIDLGMSLAGTNLDRRAALSLAQLFYNKAGTEVENAVQDQIVLDPDTGTGRLVLAHYEAFGEKLIFYGAEKGRLAYRTAILNLFIYKIKSFVLCADPQEDDLSPGSKNWLSANQWYPLTGNDLLKSDDSWRSILSTLS